MSVQKICKLANARAEQQGERGWEKKHFSRICNDIAIMKLFKIFSGQCFRSRLICHQLGDARGWTNQRPVWRLTDQSEAVRWRGVVQRSRAPPPTLRSNFLRVVKWNVRLSQLLIVECRGVNSWSGIPRINSEGNLRDNVVVYNYRDFSVTLCAILMEEEVRVLSGYCLFPCIAWSVTRARHLLPSQLPSCYKPVVVAIHGITRASASKPILSL